MATIRFRYFRPNPRLRDILVRHPKVRDRLQEIVDPLVPTAKSMAPVLTRDYANSIHGTVYLAADGLRGRLYADDWKAGLIEFGTVDTPAFHVLQRAAQSTGLRWRPIRR